MGIRGKGIKSVAGKREKGVEEITIKTSGV